MGADSTRSARAVTPGEPEEPVAAGEPAPANEPGPANGAPEDAAPANDEHAQEEQEEPEAVEHDLGLLAAKAEKAEQKAEEYLALAQRTKADFENYRKRAARDAAAAQERGLTRLVKELLPAVDNLDRAVDAATQAAGSPEVNGDPEDGALVSGIKLVHADVIAALQRVGIERFSPVGEQFDPSWHEAVAQQPVDGAQSGTVVEVYQRGYRLGDVVIRPARVLVAA